MTSEFKDPVTRQIVEFLNAIGLDVVAVKIETDTFLPGILVENGALLIDEMKLKYPGDLLHEAGHLALAASDVRRTLSGEVVLPDVAMDPVESSAIAWSYAAILHLELDPTVVFHQAGYQGASESLLFTFNVGVYPGVSGLEDASLTATGTRAAELGIRPYPHMIKWLKD